MIRLAWPIWWRRCGSRDQADLGDQMADGSFKDRTVLVFGAAGALGHGIAEAFAGQGASVIGVDRVEPPADRRLGGVRYLAADVTSDSDLGRLFGDGPTPWAV